MNKTICIFYVLLKKPNYKNKLKEEKNKKQLKPHNTHNIDRYTGRNRKTPIKIVLKIYLSIIVYKLNHLSKTCSGYNKSTDCDCCNTNSLGTSRNKLRVRYSM
ncbi:hypothetical protein NEIG_01198 [Nematocida sp. ERTm5]|nr:hypothetical protein NEIG_01198 [Nematocida sp. ERTm5]